MRYAAHYLAVGALIALAAFVEHPLVPVTTAVAGVFVVHHVWLMGHDDGWNQGCIDTTRLHDDLTDNGEDAS